jgi:hypothetical protein
MENLTNQFRKLEVNGYKQLKHGMVAALKPLQPQVDIHGTTPSGISYSYYKPPPKEQAYPQKKYYQSVFSKGRKTHKNRKASRKSRKGRKASRKH